MHSVDPSKSEVLVSLRRFSLLMHSDCPVVGCRQSYSSSAYLRSHLSQSTDSAHKKYKEDLYNALDFDVSAAVRTREATFPPKAPLQTVSIIDDNDDEDEDEQEEVLDPNDLDLVEDQEKREIVVEEEETEEDLDALAEVMEGLLMKFRLSSEEELAEYLPVLDITEEAQATPNSGSQSRKLVEDPDTRFTKWHPTAGKVLAVDSSAQERWSNLFGDHQHQSDKSYKPFHSQTDWELARWAVREKIGQGSFDRLLSIPGVRSVSNCFVYFTQDSTFFR